MGFGSWDDDRRELCRHHDVGQMRHVRSEQLQPVSLVGLEASDLLYHFCIVSSLAATKKTMHAKYDGNIA